MYATIHRRKDNPETMHGIAEKANISYWPKLRQAPGLITMYLITEEADDMRTALTIWETQEHATAFQDEENRLDQMLDQHKQILQYRAQGKIIMHVNPDK
jgi:heme-degrading monooxygenase HmoA